MMHTIKLILKAKADLRFPDGIKYGVLKIFNIVYDGQVIGHIEKEQYMDGTSLAEGFYIEPKFRNKGIGAAVLQMSEFRGAYIAPGNARVRRLYKRLSQSSWKNFSEKEREQWKHMYKTYRGMYKLK